MTLAKRPLDLEPDDRGNAAKVLIDAIRADDKDAAFEAFRVWAEMPIPGEGVNPLIEKARCLLGASRRPGKYMAKINHDTILRLLTTLAWHWEYAYELHLCAEGFDQWVLRGLREWGTLSPPWLDAELGRKLTAALHRLDNAGLAQSYTATDGTKVYRPVRNDDDTFRKAPWEI